MSYKNNKKILFSQINEKIATNKKNTKNKMTEKKRRIKIVSHIHTNKLIIQK